MKCERFIPDVRDASLRQSHRYWQGLPNLAAVPCLLLGHVVVWPVARRTVCLTDGVELAAFSEWNLQTGLAGVSSVTSSCSLLSPLVQRCFARCQQISFHKESGKMPGRAFRFCQNV